MQFGRSVGSRERGAPDKKPSEATIPRRRRTQITTSECTTAMSMVGGDRIESPRNIAPSIDSIYLSILIDNVISFLRLYLFSALFAIIFTSNNVPV